MAKEFFEVTRDRFHLEDPNCYILQGIWQKDAAMRAFLDEKQLEVKVEKQEVVSAMERFQDMDMIRGERIIAYIQLPESLSGYKKLTVYAESSDKKVCWFSVSVRELEKRKGRPQFFIEEELVQQNHLKIRGWAIADKPVRIKLFDEKKEPLQPEIIRTDRVDVKQVFGAADNDDKSGFFIEMPQITGKKFYLVFYAGEKKAVHVIHLQKAFILGKKVSKYGKKSVRYLKNQGIFEFVKKAVSKAKKVSTRPIPYEKWIQKHLPTQKELQAQTKTKFEKNPRISIVVPLYRTPEKYLLRLIQSIQAQTYSNWELCLSDGSGENSPIEKLLKQQAEKDNRIKLAFSKVPLQISENTNAAMQIATGDFIAFADHDDELTPHALFECVRAVNENPEIQIIYSDEDKMTMDGNKFFQPHFKPDFNIDLLCTVNYICHLFVVRAELAKEVGSLRKEFDGAQDYDFIFRCVEKAGADKIYHVPKILYHWRCHENSTAENQESKLYAFEAGCRAVQAHYDRIGIKAEVSLGECLGLYRTKFMINEPPLISIIIPNKDHIDDLKRCIGSIEAKSTYDNYEYIIVENNSDQPETFEYYKELEKSNPKVHVVYWDGIFNYSAINNFGAEHAKGDYLLLLNNDTEIINEDCLEELLGYCTRSDVGAVGARLYYEDDTIQHAGVVIGFGGIAGHAFVQQKRGETGYCDRIVCAQDYSAVTAACMMVKRKAFDEVGGLSEELQVAFNDIDFCMKLRKAGYLIVYNPYAELYHYESKSRGLEDTPEKVARFNREMATFEKRWPEILRDGDPFYNPNLTLDSQDFSLRRI